MIRDQIKKEKKNLSHAMQESTCDVAPSYSSDE
jgi:hypothetical protein